MRTITLSDTEQTVLIEFLDLQLTELRREIHHTDNHTYRDRLKEKGSTLEDLLNKLKEPEVATD
jgi:hypothetical protein